MDDRLGLMVNEWFPLEPEQSFSCLTSFYFKVIIPPKRRVATPLIVTARTPADRRPRPSDRDALNISRLHVEVGEICGAQQKCIYTHIHKIISLRYVTYISMD